MTPTANLRFVEREQAIGQMITHRKILQQWWEMKEFICDEMRVTGGEWRDVPIEKEQV